MQTLKEKLRGGKFLDAGVYVFSPPYVSLAIPSLQSTLSRHWVSICYGASRGYKSSNAAIDDI